MLSVFFSSKCSLFHNSNIFGSCIIYILYTGCAKIKKKNNSGVKRIVYKRRLQVKKFQSIISRIIRQHNTTNRLTYLSSSFDVGFHFLNDEKNK